MNSLLVLLISVVLPNIAHSHQCHCNVTREIISSSNNNDDDDYEIITGPNSLTGSKLSDIDEERQMYAAKMLSYMDNSVNPCDDFYQYACGNYFNYHPIRNGYHAIDNWMIVGYQIQSYLHELLSDQENNENIAEIKAKKFYQSCMITDIFKYETSDTYLKFIEQKFGGWPAKDLNNWNSDNFDWFKIVLVLKSIGINAILYTEIQNKEIYVSAKHFGLIPMNSDDYAMPYTSTYRINKKLSMQLMQKYGISAKNARESFNEIMNFGKFGTELYENFSNSSGNKYDNITIDEFIQLIPEIPEFFWKIYFLNIFGINYSPTTIRINADDINYFRILFDFIGNAERHVIANYLILTLLSELHDEIEFPKYRSDYCMTKTNEFFGPVVDSMFMRSKYRNERAEQEVLAMAPYLKNALEDIIKSTEWLDNDVKKHALKKIKLLHINVDDFDFSLDIDELNEIFQYVKVNRNSFHKNVLSMREHLHFRRFRELLEDKDYYTTDVNAFYHENRNMVVLPAGIFHKPLYYPELPKAYNFGVMGGKILGHEIMHAFDSDCIDYDAHGTKNSWMDIETRIIFDEKTQCLIDQYNSYRMDEIDQNVNGERTLGENISDNGGLKIGYYGYKKWLQANQGSIDLKREILPGLNLTNMQLYFVSYGQGLCGIYKQKGIKKMADDEHVIEKWRTIGSIVNFDEFSKEFDCKLGTPMNPENKCKLW